MVDFPLVGNKAEIKTQALMAMMISAVLKNKDVGQFVGDPIKIWQKERLFDTCIRFIMTSNNPKESSIFGGNPQLAKPSIPGVDLSGLTWSKLKNALGGNAGWKYGRKFCRVRWDNAKGSQTCIYASTLTAAREIIKELDTLCPYDIASQSCGEEEAVGEKATGGMLHKKTVQVYPAYASLFVTNKGKKTSQGRPTLNGKQIELTKRVRLWPDKEPPEWSEWLEYAKQFKLTDNSIE